jgi:ankyrin repeat protein
MGFVQLLVYLHSNFKSSVGDKKLPPKGAEKMFSDNKIIRFRTYFKDRPLPGDAIATAAFYGQTEITRFCVEKGLDIEQEGPFGTPLRAASLMGHDSTVRILLTLGADVNTIGSFGDALQAAAMKGHLSVTTTLIKHGARLDKCGGYYGTALQAATYLGNANVVEVLLKAGAPIGQRGLFDDAVGAAVSAGNDIIFDLLIASGYRSTHPQNNGRWLAPMYRKGPSPSGSAVQIG